MYVPGSLEQFLAWSGQVGPQADGLRLRDIDLSHEIPLPAIKLAHAHRRGRSVRLDEPRTGEDREQVLDDLELQVERELARLRLGPVLGLAGTLIPLGPAMGALATGDVATLSSQLVVSFTTTVLGLLVGAVCFVLHTIRRNWYRQDLTDIDHAVRQGS